jgi:TrmH family RNA methyltransferase
LAKLRVVLVRPESPGNVGAVARVIKNTGLLGLDLVAPTDWRTVECWRQAWGAPEVLERARVFASLPEALADCQRAFAFTGRRDRGIPLLDVRQAAAEAASLGSAEEARLVFGPEASGLTQAEMACCHRVTIPSHPAQPSLNLSHAVMVAAYEVFRAEVRAPAPPPTPRATGGEKEALLGLLREGLLAIGALAPAGGGESRFREWRAFVQRADLTERELHLLEHLAHRMRGAALDQARAR